MESTLSYKPLPAICEPWHQCHIDVLLLERIKRHRSSVHEVLHEGQRAISKIALFEWDFHGIGNEIRMCSTINKHQDEHQAKLLGSPKFLDYLTENGRVMGFFLEKLGGEFASMDDLPNCKKVLHKLREMDLIHGDVDRSSKNVRMINFEYAEDLRKES
jgi:hypothetical protein